MTNNCNKKQLNKYYYMSDDCHLVVYSKSDCKNCEVLKRILKLVSLKFVDINCDILLSSPHEREHFIDVMKNKIKPVSNVEKIHFPIMFYHDLYVENPYELIDNLKECF